VTNYVVDASVAVKWYIPEPWFEKAVAYLKLLEQMKVNLYAPDLIIPELGNALWKKKLKGELTSQEAREIADIISEYFPIRIVNSKYLLPSAMEISATYNINIYTSMYLALTSIKDARLLTADRKLVQIVNNTVFKELVFVINR
jgi:predicted nucleic acid-binding protein